MSHECNIAECNQSAQLTAALLKVVCPIYLILYMPGTCKTKALQLTVTGSESLGVVHIRKLADLTLYRKASYAPYAAPATTRHNPKFNVHEVIVLSRAQGPACTYRSSKCTSHCATGANSVDTSVVHSCGHAQQFL